MCGTANARNLSLIGGVKCEKGKNSLLTGYRFISVYHQNSVCQQAFFISLYYLNMNNSITKIYIAILLKNIKISDIIR